MKALNERNDNSPTLTSNKLRDLISYASVNVPYYRDQFDKLRIQASDIRSMSEFRQIPCVTKPMIQEQWADFLSQDYLKSELIYTNTSGSTGTPLRIATTKMERVIATRHLMNARMKWGLRFPVRWATLGRVIHLIEGSHVESESRIKFGSGDLLTIPGIDMSPSYLQDCVNQLDDFQPAWVYGMPSILSRLAEHIIATRQTLKLKDLHLIELAGEYASPEVRGSIQSAFQHSPASQYSCQEVLGVAFECPLGGMHILNKHVCLEIIKEDGEPAQPGEIGQAVITSLNRRAMPFIRYRLGDLVMPLAEPCKCQEQGPLIKMIGGRTTDFIVGQPSKIGTLIFDKIFLYLINGGFNGLREFRVVQRSESLFEVYVVATTNWNSEIQELFVNVARNILGENMEFKFWTVDKIPPMGNTDKQRSFFVDLF